MNDLAELLRTSTVSAPPPSVEDLTDRANRRRRVRAGAAGAVLAILLAAGAVILRPGQAPNRIDTFDVPPSTEGVTSTLASTAAPSTAAPPTSDTTQPSPQPPPEVDTPDLLALVDQSVTWSSPELLGDGSIWVSDVGPEGRRVVVREPTGQLGTGCEGQDQPLYRFVVSDFDTGQRQVLFDLSTNEIRTRFGDPDAINSYWVELGPAGRFAVLGGCDANARLAAVGTLQPDGTVELVTPPGNADPGGYPSITGGGNAGVSVTWSADGALLFLNTVAIDTTTGQRIDVLSPESPLDLRAQLVDGSTLVSSHSGAESAFWLLPPGETTDAVPARPAQFAGQTSYPAVQIEVSPDGALATVVFRSDFDQGRSVIIDADRVLELPGLASLSADNTTAVINTRRTADDPTSPWAIVDIETGASAEVPTGLFDGAILQMAWADDPNGLLVTVAGPERADGDPLEIWYLPVPDLGS